MTFKPGWLARGERPPHANTSPATVREIRRRVKAGESQKAVAKDLGINGEGLDDRQSEDLRERSG